MILWFPGMTYVTVSIKVACDVKYLYTEIVNLELYLVALENKGIWINLENQDHSESDLQQVVSHY